MGFDIRAYKKEGVGLTKLLGAILLLVTPRLCLSLEVQR